MELADLHNVPGLSIQFAGVLLIAALYFFTARSINRRFLVYWTIGWASLAAALAALLVSSHFPSSRSFLHPIYFFGEYVFGFLLVAGCTRFASNRELPRRAPQLLVPLGVWSAILPFLSDDFQVLFVPHAAILAMFFLAAYVSLRPAFRHAPASPGLRVMSVALLLLAVDFLHYVPVVGYAVINGVQVGYLQYNSIYDLILEILLGFGAMMVVMEDVRNEIEQSNRELLEARDRLEVLARLDPLTEALNRHAFYSLLKGSTKDPISRAPGCVVVIDIDNLKPINDSFGHNAGDAVIREVAGSIRNAIRADDLLFRWGGDEFLVLMFQISEQESRKRIAELNETLSRTVLPGSAEPIEVIVSCGFAPFEGLHRIEKAIESADEAMYALKQERKGREIRPEDTVHAG